MSEPKLTERNWGLAGPGLSGPCLLRCQARTTICRGYLSQMDIQYSRIGDKTTAIGLTLNLGNTRGIDFERYRIARD